MDFLIKSHSLKENDGESIILINHSYARCHAIRKIGLGTPPTNTSIIGGRGNLPGMLYQSAALKNSETNSEKFASFPFAHGECKEVSGNTHAKGIF